MSFKFKRQIVVSSNKNKRIEKIFTNRPGYKKNKFIDYKKNVQ